VPDGLALELIVLPWLAFAAILDQRHRRVPNWLTLPGLLGGALYAAFSGKWELALLVMLLVVTADFPSYISLGVGTAFLVLLPIITGNGQLTFTGSLMLAVIFLWRLGAIGGADAKVLLALPLFFGGGVLLVVFLVGGFYGLAALVLHRKSIPYVTPIFLGTSLYFLIHPQF